MEPALRNAPQPLHGCLIDYSSVRFLYYFRDGTAAIAYIELPSRKNQNVGSVTGYSKYEC